MRYISSLVIAYMCTSVLFSKSINGCGTGSTKVLEESVGCFDISMSAPFGPAYYLRRIPNGLLYGYRKNGKFIERKIALPDNEHWRAFWASVDQVQLWKWSGRYIPNQADGTKSDAETWAVRICHNGNKTYSTADGVYPSDNNPKVSESDFVKSNRFIKFEKASAELIGVNSLYSGNE